MDGNGPSVAVAEAAQADPVAEIQAALHSLARSLKRSALHDFLLAQARVDADQAGMAVLYVLHLAGAGLRLTDLAERLSVDAPAVTRKVQQLERCGLVSRAQDQLDARASRVHLTAAGRRTIGKFLAARRTWLANLVSDWTEQEKAVFARLLDRFAGDIRRQLEELGE
jgi:DNA-binding MarR family transcriptional regulator